MVENNDIPTNDQKSNLIKHIKKTDEKTLSFDFKTGELIVSDNPNNNSVVVDQIYKDGFFYFKKVA